MCCKLFVLTIDVDTEEVKFKAERFFSDLKISFSVYCSSPNLMSYVISYEEALYIGT